MQQQQQHVAAINLTASTIQLNARLEKEEKEEEVDVEKGEVSIASYLATDAIYATRENFLFCKLDYTTMLFRSGLGYVRARVCTTWKS